MKLIMEKPDKLEEGQVWKYHCPVEEKAEIHIVTKSEADNPKDN